MRNVGNARLDNSAFPRRGHGHILRGFAEGFGADVSRAREERDCDFVVAGKRVVVFDAHVEWIRIRRRFKVVGKPVVGGRSETM